ncbi:hypothetical protein [Sulfolobus sp. E11-6]|uniref:hypothetical protein n=1 Tax=Sulfolobus sp. E11-6 TaxID=2663020 RepID=UPI001294D55E|nr:hypothetical protein [Sulfolobus sp. E11-6]QGA68990.1 hypothetical protein GFS33_09965 [Sulfolobus sp. E11-6]
MKEKLSFLEIKNEFSKVRISIDFSGNSPRFKVECFTSGITRYIDPLTMEILMQIPDNILERYIYSQNGR